MPPSASLQNRRQTNRILCKEAHGKPCFIAEARPSDGTQDRVNRANKTRVRSSLRALREALQKGDAKSVGEQYRATVSALDKSVQKGTLHKNTASRYKSRLSARVKAVSAKAY